MTSSRHNRAGWTALAAGAIPVALALLFLGAPRASEAQAESEDPAVLGAPSGARLSLEEAVTRGLRNRADTQLAIQRLSEREGAHQEQAGVFDPLFFVDTSFEMRQQELLRSGYDFEVRRRLPPDLAIPELERAVGIMVDNLPTSESLLFQECTATQDRFNVLVNAPEGPLEVTLCFDGFGELQRIVPRGDLRDSLDLLGVIDVLRKIGSLSDEVSRDLEAGFADRLRVLVRGLRTIIAAMRTQLANLGCFPSDNYPAEVGFCIFPEIEQSLDLRFEMGQQWRFHNGIAVTASLQLAGTEDNYRGKPLDPVLGDQVAPNTFSTTGSLSLDIPLAKGRGKKATAAALRATEVAVDAERNVLLHTTAGTALFTIQSYWELAAAEKRLALLVDSARVQTELLENTRALIDEDALAGAEAYRVEASYADALNRVATARRTLIETRLDLVDAMGQHLERITEAPLAADPLPTAEDTTLDAEAWVDTAYANRWDLEGNRLATRASEILVDAARANLRHQVDLTLNVSYNGFHESFDDRLYDFGGYSDAASGLISGPSYLIRLRWKVPFRNRSARGRLVQARASVNQSRINETELERQIRLAIFELVKRIDAKKLELEQQAQNLSSLEDSLEASLERFRLGDLTLIDTLTTEQQLTAARLALVDIESELAILLSQLRFESGTLVEAPEDFEEFDTSDVRLLGNDS